MTTKYAQVQDFFRQNAIQILGVIVIILNLWLTTKLTPMATNISILDLKVQAIEANYTKLQDTAALKQEIIDVNKNLQTLQSDNEKEHQNLSNKLDQILLNFK